MVVDAFARRAFLMVHVCLCGHASSIEVGTHTWRHVAEGTLRARRRAADRAAEGSDRNLGKAEALMR
jgi:hypothetical protein